MSIPYCIEDKRELSIIEHDILLHLVRDSGLVKYESQIKDLKVIARCGCGECPTIMFGKTFDSKPVKGSVDLVRCMGISPNGTTIGIALMGTETELKELEAWSCCGGDFNTWPNISTFKSMSS